MKKKVELKKVLEHSQPNYVITQNSVYTKRGPNNTQKKKGF